MLKPVYQAELKRNMRNLGADGIEIKLGTVPLQLREQEIEGNLVIINKGLICYNTFFLDIPRSLWELLPMGLYADTLIYETASSDNEQSRVPYAKQLDFTIRFSKNSASYNVEDLKPILDSMKKFGLHITSMHIRAYSSVEGSTNANANLQNLRAASVIKALQQKQAGPINSSVTTLENWMEFYRDISGTSFAKMKQISRQEIKQQLTEPGTLSQLEPILQKHRKAVVTLYLDKNSGEESTEEKVLENKFKKAIADKKINEAAAIQREIFSRIIDSRLPSTYLGRLEIPQEKLYSGLLTNQATYKFYLQDQPIDETIEAFKSIVSLDPSNAKARYNLCASTINRYAKDTTGLQPDSIREQIQSLQKYKIATSLITRMKLNLNIILSEYYMSRYEYDKKDKAAREAVQYYSDLDLNDGELLTMAKYLSYYSLLEMAEKILSPRVGRIDVSEDLVFYYLNLKLFRPAEYQTEEFKTILNNALTLNNARFCRLFRSQEHKGIGFQLLEDPFLRSAWCEQCSKLPGMEVEDMKRNMN
ncbi:MAG: hypothetical protein J7578_13320 [Chitinophagaceae bacterium]|nr:hypothetical protein [Chitinophagaceae bacterium]